MSKPEIKNKTERLRVMSEGKWDFPFCKRSSSIIWSSAIYTSLYFRFFFFVDLLNRRIHPVYILIHNIDVPKNHCRSIQNGDCNWSICLRIVHRSASFITEKLHWISQIRKFGKWNNIICFHWLLSIYATLAETRKTWTVVGKMFITNRLNIWNEIP